MRRVGGASVLQASMFMNECTHLVVKQANRYEKFLACCAAGKWLVRQALIDDSLAAGAWQREEDYEIVPGVSPSGVELGPSSSACTRRASRARRRCVTTSERARVC